MKKILHIQVLPKLSGVQNISYEILKVMSNEEYDKTIMFSSEGTTGDKLFLETQFKNIGVKIIYSKHLVRELNLKKDLLAFKEIYSLCKKEKYDIVHTHSSKPGVIGRIAAKLAGIPLVIHTVHGLSFHKFIKFPKWQFYWLCEMFSSLFCHKIVLVNKYYMRYFNFFKRKTSTIYNGLDFSKFNGIKKVTQKDNNTINVLFVGRLDTPKNPLCLLKAAKIIINNNRNVIFTIVGDGMFYNDCKNYIETNHLNENIKMVGWQNNPATYYAEADIFAASSIYESFGLMFIEAGYYGVPVCATNVEGIPEVVKHGESGLLCNPNDPDALAANILTLCNDSDLRERMGNENHRIATQTFSVNKMTNSYQALYENYFDKNLR